MFYVLIALICLDFPPVCIPVCRRYRYKRDDTGATYVHGATGCIHDTQAPRDPYAHRPPAWTPVTPFRRATFPSGQNMFSNPKAPDLSLGDLSDPFLRIFMILRHFWTLLDASDPFWVLFACPFLSGCPFCLPFPWIPLTHAGNHTQYTSFFFHFRPFLHAFSSFWCLISSFFMLSTCL